MNCYLTTRFGCDIKNPSDDEINDALAELDLQDSEHLEVTLRNEGEWSLSVYPSGKVVLENLEEGGPLHMKAVSRERLKELWRLMASGEMGAIQKESWVIGYGND